MSYEDENGLEWNDDEPCVECGEPKDTKVCPYCVDCVLGIDSEKVEKNVEQSKGGQ